MEEHSPLLGHLSLFMVAMDTDDGRQITCNIMDHALRLAEITPPP